MPGLTLWNVPGSATIRSCRSQRHSARSPAPDCSADLTAMYPSPCWRMPWSKPASRWAFSSVHVTFCTKNEWDGLGEAGWLQRIGMQFHWENQGYADFEGFLGALSSRKRKVLRRERRDANAAGLTFHALSGADITERHWDAFYAFYQSTVDRKWGSAYLTRSFFSLLGGTAGRQGRSDVCRETPASRSPVR